MNSRKKSLEESDVYIQAPVQEVVDEWMTARNGTIEASGKDAYYYAGEKEIDPVDTTSRDMRYDLPGETCSIEEGKESARADLAAWTDLLDAPETDLDTEIEKVADFWRSQDWGEIYEGGAAKNERSIIVYTTLGTRIIYRVRLDDGQIMKSIRMTSGCVQEFSRINSKYLGDFNDRFDKLTESTNPEESTPADPADNQPAGQDPSSSENPTGHEGRE